MEQEATCQLEQLSLASPEHLLPPGQQLLLPSSSSPLLPPSKQLPLAGTPPLLACQPLLPASQQLPPEGQQLPPTNLKTKSRKISQPCPPARKQLWSTAKELPPVSQQQHSTGSSLQLSPTNQKHQLSEAWPGLQTCLTTNKYNVEEGSISDNNILKHRVSAGKSQKKIKTPTPKIEQFECEYCDMIFSVNIL